MGRNNIAAATIYALSVLFSLLVLAMYILGAARYLTNLEDNTCEMTYMFEYPQYVKIALNEKTDEKYPRFGLYAYSEGFVTEKHRRMQFSGIPVLFVPGNAGSHEQVRSLASVSLRKTLKDRKPYHFDYFTVSLGKDYSALYGGILRKQTTYVSLCIYKILELYKGDVQQIVLIGHSMGGIVAKGVLAKYTFRWNNMTSIPSILLTLASSHRPIFLPDGLIAQYYSNIELLRKKIAETGTIIVSIGGGQRDVVVSTAQTIDPFADINAVSSAIPDVWRSTDHLCILWCKQLVLTIVRALMDCVDTNTRPPAITFNRESKLQALTYHFKSRFSGKQMPAYKDMIEFERGAMWIEDIRRQYTWTSKGRWNTNRSVFLMVRLDTGSSYNRLTIDSINLDTRDWLFACSAHAIEGNSRVCSWAWNLTNRTRLTADPLHRLRKSVDLSLDEIRNLEDSRGIRPSHVIVRIPVSVLRDKKDHIRIHFDVYKRSDRTKSLHRDTSTLSILFSISGIFSADPYAVFSSRRGDTQYQVFLNQIPDAVSVEIEPIEEDNNDDDDDEDDDVIDGEKRVRQREPPQVVLELLEAPDDEDSRAGYTMTQVRATTLNKKDGEPGKKRLVMHLATRGNAFLRIRLSPNFSYRVTIRRAGIVERVACSVRDRWPTLYPILAALCFIAIAIRMDDSAWRTAITIGITIVGSIYLDLAIESLVAFGLLHVFAVTTCCLVIFCGSLVNNTIARLFSRITLIPSAWFTWVICGLDCVPFVMTIILLTLCTLPYAGFAVLFIALLLFLKLTRMYDDYLEQLFMASLRQFIPFEQRRRKRKRRIAAAASTMSVPLLDTDETQQKQQQQEEEEQQQKQKQEQQEKQKQEQPEKQKQEQQENQQQKQEQQENQQQKQEQQENQQQKQQQSQETDEKSEPIVNGDSSNSREVILNNLLLFITWTVVVLPTIPSVLMWAKNFTYDPILHEDIGMRFSWTWLTVCVCFDFLDTGTLLGRKRLGSKLCTSCTVMLRALAWFLLYTSSLTDTAYYQWIVPPIAAVAFFLLAFRGIVCRLTQ